MSRTRLWLIFVMTGALTLAGCSTSPTVPPWPDATEVKRITAVVSGSVTEQPDLDEFEIPKEYVSDVHRVLYSPKYLKHPSNCQEVGRLQIHCYDGRILAVRLMYFGKEAVLFTVDGVPCVRGGLYMNLSKRKDDWKYLPEVLTLQELLRAIHRQDDAKARHYLDLLNQSAGRVTPSAK